MKKLLLAALASCGLAHAATTTVEIPVRATEDGFVVDEVFSFDASTAAGHLLTMSSSAATGLVFTDPDGDKGSLTVSADGTTWTVDAAAVANSMLANMAEATFKGRADGAGTGAPVDLTATQGLAIVKTVDGAGSGLDADLLDGTSSAGFAASAHTHAEGDVTNLTTDLAAKAPLASPTFSGVAIFPNTGLHLLDTNASDELILSPGSNLTADRTLTLITGDIDRTLTLSGDFTGSGTATGTNTGDQTSVSGNAGTVTFADAGGDSTTSVALGTAATGSLAPATDAGLTYDATANILTVSGSVAAALTGNADTATASTTAAANDNDTSIATTAFVQQEIDDDDNLSDNCVIENDATPIPDSCVGDGSDASGTGAPTTVDYLVGTADGGLSAEIVVGTSPGGELGNTWASPTLDDSVAVTSWNLTTPTITTDITIPNTGLHLLDTNATHDLIVAPGSDLTADRTLTVTTGDAARTLTISGDATVSQDYSTAGSPQLTALNVGHASDTTIARVSAGVISVEGVNVLLNGGAGGTPSSLTLTNATGLPTAGLVDDAVTYAKMQNVSATDRVLGRSTAGAGDVEEIACTSTCRSILDDASTSAVATTLGLGTGDSPQFTAVNVGHASDTTIARSSAGLISIEGTIIYPRTCVYTTSDQTAIGTSFANVTGLSFSVAASTNYIFEFFIWADADATTTGIDVAANGPAIGAGTIVYSQRRWGSTTADTSTRATAYDNNTAATASGGATALEHRVVGVLRNGANAGTLAARIKREAVGTGPNVRSGSWGCIQQVT